MAEGGNSRRETTGRGEAMLTPDAVAAMVQLHWLGWGSKRIAAELGCARNTVKRYVAAGGWVDYRRPARQRQLAGLETWLSERFHRHRGNCDVVRQDLAREHGIAVSLRTLERAVAPLRQGLQAEARATLRFETPPGKQLQIDFGELFVPIGGERVKLYLFVATLGYSRLPYVRAFRHERQSAWLDGLEGAFRHCNGVPREVLLDNARALVEHHDAQTREVRFNERLKAFAKHWGFRACACAPYRARTKGKDERGVGYVKRNAIAGHSFASWAALEAHLAWWMREVADVRDHGTTGEPPRLRFERDEAAALQPLDGRPPFGQVRELVRRVQADCAIEVDANSYSVPWRLVGETVQVIVAEGRIRVSHAGQEIAVHAVTTGRRQRIVDAAHFHGVAGTARPAAAPALAAEPAPELLRPLAEYEQIAGGGW
ncbi:MAG TPA: IS21 family transposase [Acetobacteraceae bacterium]|jgi:transposase|nr:IS21 family transposase [Acetobacteraceae bacterium]